LAGGKTVADEYLLFAQVGLDEFLGQRLQEVLRAIQSMDIEALLSASEDDLIVSRTDAAKALCPVIHEDRAVQRPATEGLQAVRTFRGIVQRTEPLIALELPFEGDARLFTCAPTIWNGNQPSVRRIHDRFLELTWCGTEPEKAVLETHFNERIANIQKHLSWARADVDRHNNRIVGEIAGTVTRRRNSILQARGVQAQMGFPIKRRPDADTYVVPVTAKKLRPARPAGPVAPFQPEPGLEEGDYEAALAVLNNMRNAFERSPSVTAALGEEMMRDVLLIGLNSQFQGQAAGELFNRFGKTDIMIRVDDRNVFVGECKIWEGPATIEEALGDQLLNRYLTWRDTKAALLMFIFRKNISEAVAKADEAVRAHPNFKRPGKHQNDTRIDYIFHANGDVDREIQLALLPFAFPDIERKPSSKQTTAEPAPRKVTAKKAR
jgi:hypothetical protein